MIVILNEFIHRILTAYKQHVALNSDVFKPNDITLKGKTRYEEAAERI